MAKDYLIDADADLRIESGDFVDGESTLQHQQLLTEMQKGDLRQFPKTAIGIHDFLLDENPGDAYIEAQKQFKADGMLVRKLELELNETENKLEIKSDGYYP